MKKSLKIISAIAVLAIIAGIAYYTFRQSPDSVKNVKPDFLVESSVLVDEFFEDENLANQKYLDKIIQLEGVILNIEQNTENKTTIYIEGNPMGNISCLFDNEELKKAKIEVGQTKTVKGKCTGFILDVVLTKCALVE